MTQEKASNEAIVMVHPPVCCICNTAKSSALEIKKINKRVCLVCSYKIAQAHSEAITRWYVGKNFDELVSEA